MILDFDSTYLETLRFYDIQINGEGPKSVRGKIISIAKDFLTIQLRKEITFYKTSAIKKIIFTNNSSPEFHTKKNSGLLYEEVNSFLELMNSLQGNYIRLNRGKADHGYGTLYKIFPEYITLKSAEGKLAYYRYDSLECISVTKDKYFFKKPFEKSNTPEHLESKQFEEMLNLFIGSNVHINMEALGHKNGLILAAPSDYLVLCGPDLKTTYYPKEKIHNIGQIGNSVQGINRKHSGNSEERALLKGPDFIRAENFDDLLEHLLNKRVHIHLSYPTGVTGTLIAITADCLIVKEDKCNICYVNKNKLYFISQEIDTFVKRDLSLSELIKPTGFNQLSNMLTNQTVLLDRLGEDFKIADSENSEIITLTDGELGLVYLSTEGLGKLVLAVNWRKNRTRRDTYDDKYFRERFQVTPNKGEKMNNVLERLKGQKTVINFLEPESVMGTLFDVFNEFIVILFFNKTILIPIHQINSIFVRSFETK